MTWPSKKINMENRGQECSTPGCHRRARCKGLCLKCRQKKYIDAKNTGEVS